MGSQAALQFCTAAADGLAINSAAAAALQGCRRLSSAAANPEGPPAFVFDIDGVLIRGGTVLPAARRALAKLYQPGGEGCMPTDAAVTAAAIDA